MIFLSYISSLDYSYLMVLLSVYFDVLSANYY